MKEANSQSNFNLDADHLAIRVTNLKRSADFYENILKLKEIYNGGLGDGFRWFKLKNGFQIHLIASKDVIEKYKGVHFALNTENLEDFMRHLDEKGVHFENWSGEKGVTNTRPDGIRQIYFQDPDGYWIEVNENELN